MEYVFYGIGFVVFYMVWRVWYILRQHYGWSVSLDEVAHYVDVHLRGGCHKSRLRLRHEESGRRVEFSSLLKNWIWSRWERRAVRCKAHRRN